MRLREISPNSIPKIYKYSPAIGLLAVHGSISMADALLIACEGDRSAGEDHAEAARKLRSCCSARGIEARGIKHFEWLLGKKNLFSYEARPVTDAQLSDAKLKMDQFFAWALLTFPAVAQLMGSKNA
jgi:hypothetical protein